MSWGSGQSWIQRKYNFAFNLFSTCTELVHYRIFALAAMAIPTLSDMTDV